MQDTSNTAAGAIAGLDVDVIAFDVFGTVVDWYSTVVDEALALRPDMDAQAFATSWREGYFQGMRAIAAGQLPWMRIDELHRRILDDIAQRFGLGGLDEPQRRRLNRVWHRLAPWPDSVAALHRLKRRFTICTLSNGNLGLLANMAKHAGLPWDCVLSAEVFRAFKPDPATYTGVCSVFDVPPQRVLMVAAHHFDLEGARACGLKTAYIERPLEFGPAQPKDVSPRPGNDLHCRDLGDLASRLGA